MFKNGKSLSAYQDAEKMFVLFLQSYLNGFDMYVERLAAMRDNARSKANKKRWAEAVALITSRRAEWPCSQWILSSTAGVTQFAVNLIWFPEDWRLQLDSSRKLERVLVKELPDDERVKMVGELMGFVVADMCGSELNTVPRLKDLRAAIISRLHGGNGLCPSSTLVNQYLAEWGKDGDTVRERADKKLSSFADVPSYKESMRQIGGPHGFECIRVLRALICPRAYEK
jgi:hypothetical protein